MNDITFLCIYIEYDNTRRSSAFLHRARASATEANELQQEEEQGDDVQIEVESSEHILLRRDFILPVLSTQNKLGVKHQVLQRDRLRRDASALQTLTSEGTL